MDIRLNPFYTALLRQLVSMERERTATAMIRQLIRQAAKERNIWPVSSQADENLTEITE